jgi:hypothetical protein
MRWKRLGKVNGPEWMTNVVMEAYGLGFSMGEWFHRDGVRR